MLAVRRRSILGTPASIQPEFGILEWDDDDETERSTLWSALAPAGLPG
ncbi:MAG: hypothetical protein HUU26_01520 [Gemmatimonadaceae bacterium]|nr:hypothetical protein [Gemmatimonadaceae bacterium]